MTTFEPRNHFHGYMRDAMAMATHYGERAWIQGPQQIQLCDNNAQAEYLVEQLNKVERLRKHKFWADDKYVMMLRNGHKS